MRKKNWYFEKNIIIFYFEQETDVDLIIVNATIQEKYKFRLAVDN